MTAQVVAEGVDLAAVAVGLGLGGGGEAGGEAGGEMGYALSETEESSLTSKNHH